MSEPLDRAAESMLEQGYQQLQAGEFDRAVETFSACLILEPQETRAFRDRGLAHVQLKRWADASEDFSKAREFNPDDVDSGIELGISLAMGDQVYPALRVFETVLARHPDSAKAHLQLGLLYLKLCVVAKGREHLAQALACHPTMEERRLIDANLREQDKLDRQRYYRPDFEALRRQHPGGFARLKAWWHQRVSR